MPRQRRGRRVSNMRIFIPKFAEVAESVGRHISIIGVSSAWNPDVARDAPLFSQSWTLGLGTGLFSYLLMSTRSLNL